LEHGVEIVAEADFGSDPTATFGAYIADLYSSPTEHRDCRWVVLVAGLGDQLHGFSGRAERDLEQPIASIGIGVDSPDHR
jgi:hypothetical protein